MGGVKGGIHTCSKHARPGPTPPHLPLGGPALLSGVDSNTRPAGRGQGSLTSGGTLILSLTLPCGPPEGQGQVGHPGAVVLSGVGSLVILSPRDTWRCLEAFYWEWG